MKMTETNSSLSDEATPHSNILDPEHPLLERFQRVLKEHLTLQIENLKSEIFELETDNKKNSTTKDDLAVSIYETQQFVCKQQKQLDDIVTELRNVTELRTELENAVSEERRELNDKQQLMISTQKDDTELQNELEAMNLLTKQMSEWESRMESEIVISKRVSEKTRKDQLRLAEEKKFQDMIIFRVLKEIWRIESDIETLNMQIAVKSKEEEELAHMQTMSNINVEALQTEYKSLVHSWNSVIVAIGNRDKVVECLNLENGKIEVNIKAVLNEMENVKKLIKEEMQTNEYLTVLKNRNETTLNNSKRQIDDELNRRQRIEQQIYEKQAIIEQLQKDVEESLSLNKQLEKCALSSKVELDKLLSEKQSIENRIIKMLEMQFSNNTVAQNLHKSLCALKISNNNLEIGVVEAENKHRQRSSAIEMQMYVNKKYESELEEFEVHLKDMEKQATIIKSEISKCDTKIKIAERDVERLNIRVESASKGELCKGSPQKLKITILEKHIDELQEDIKKLQSYWLREQVNLITISKERQGQILHSNLLKKQLTILAHKNLRIDNEIETIGNQQTKVSRNIHNLMNKFDYQYEILYRKRGIKSNLNNKQDVFHLEATTKLKECEMDCLNLESEIAEIEEDKVALSGELLECNREALEWDKKVKLARETKQHVIEAKSKGGEIELMKQEIHRMEVRYSQLKKAQEKLIKDLELCISRRDAIYMESEAKKKRNKGVEDKIRFNFTRKIDDVRNKIKQLHDEIEHVKSSIELTKVQCEHLREENVLIEQEMSSFQASMQHLVTQIEVNKTNRELKFELLLLSQKKLNMYSDLVKGRTPYTIYRTESQLTCEYNKQKDVNNKLCTIVENLTVDFPQHNHLLARIYNSLKIPAICLL